MIAPSSTALAIGTTTATVPAGRAGVITLRRVTWTARRTGIPATGSGAGRGITTGITGIPVHLMFNSCT